MFFPKQIKFFADGAIISQLMQMKDGYLDGHRGEWIMPPEQLEERARLFWNAGYQIHTHVNGDLGLEVVLNILEKLMAEDPRADHRSVIVHFANSSEEQVARIARLGAIVSANPYYPVGFADKYSEYGLGPAARRRDGSREFGAQEKRTAVVPFRSADGSGFTAQFHVVRRQPHDTLGSRRRTRAADHGRSGAYAP